jgi:hypothetical protein
MYVCLLTVNHLARDKELVDAPHLKEKGKWAWGDERKDDGGKHN